MASQNPYLVQFTGAFTPEMAIEARNGLHYAANRDLFGTVKRARWALSGEQRDPVVHDIVTHINQMQIVLWNEETWGLAASGAEDFIDQPLPDIARPEGGAQIWFHEMAWVQQEELKGAFEVPTDAHCAAFCVLNTAGYTADGSLSGNIGITVGIFYIPLSWPPTPYVRLFPFHRETDPLWGPLALIAAGLEFMALPVVSSSPVYLDRAAQRRYLRRMEEPAPTVRVVKLRRAGRESTEHEPSDIQWSCRWFVRGHRRLLPTGGATWVHGHIKGPADKPIRPPAESVFRVVR